MDLPKWLEKNNVSSYEFARKIGVYPSTLYRFLKKHGKTSIKTAEKIEFHTDGQVTKEECIFPKFDAVVSKSSRGRKTSTVSYFCKRCRKELGRDE